MAYQWTEHTVGSRPWVSILLGIPDGAVGPLDTCVVYPGGGFGARDPGPFMDAAHPGAKPLIEGGLMNPGGPYFEAHAIAIVTIASQSHQPQASSLDYPAWQAGEAVLGDAPRFFGGNLYRAKSPHTTEETVGGTIGNEPGTVAAPTSGSTLSGAELWHAIERNNIGYPRIPGRGELTNGYGGQAIADIRSSSGWLYANRVRLGLTGKRYAFGDSAGANQLLAAVALGSAPHGKGADTAAAHVAKATASTQFDAVISDICPAKWDLFMTTEITGGNVQELLLSIMPTLFGEPNIGMFANWAALSDDIKRSIDPYWIALDSGFSVPTYFTTTSSYWDDTLPVDIYNGKYFDPMTIPSEIIAEGPEVHHAYHSKVLMELFTSDPATNGGVGHNNDRCVHFQGTLTPDLYRRQLRYPNGGNGTELEDYTLINATPAELPVTLGEDLLDWVTGILSA